MMRSCILLILLPFVVEGVFGEKTATAGHPFILKSGVTKRHQDTVQWYFSDTLIAEINGDPSTSCSYEGVGGTFRDSMMHYETGSLIITDISLEHTGRYEAHIYRSDDSGTKVSLDLDSTCNRSEIIKGRNDLYTLIKSFRLTVAVLDSGQSPVVPHSGQFPAVPRSGQSPVVPHSGQSPAVPGSCVPPAAVVGIVVGVVALVVALAVGVMIYLRRSSRNDEEKKKPPLLSQKV